MKSTQAQQNSSHDLVYALVWLGLAALIWQVVAGGHTSYYVGANISWLVKLGGAVCLVVGLLLLFRVIYGFTHGRTVSTIGLGSILSLAIFVFPFIVSVAVTPRAFGSNTLRDTSAVINVAGVGNISARGNGSPVPAVAATFTPLPTMTLPPTAVPATDTPAPTDTAQPTDTPIPTDTAVASDTPLPTATTTVVGQPTKLAAEVTPTPSSTTKATSTPKATATPAPSKTPKPTATPKPTNTSALPTTSTPVPLPPTATPVPKSNSYVGGGNGLWQPDMLELSNAIDDGSVGERKFQVLGFVFRKYGLPDNTFILTRYITPHCAAEQRALGVLLTTPDAANYADDQWLLVTGVIGSVNADGKDVPVIKSITIQPATEPDPAYIIY